MIFVSASKFIGQHSRVKSERLVYYRDNVLNGIEKGGDIFDPRSAERRFYKVRDGYIRDVYPCMFVQDIHMDRAVEGQKLGQFLLNKNLASIERYGDHWKIDVPTIHLERVQQLFDKNDITLSGRPLIW